MQPTIAEVIATHVDALANQLVHLLPWVKHLDAAARADLLADLAQACTQGRHTGQSQALLEALEDWEATAQALSDTPLTDCLLSPMTEQDYTPWEVVRAHISGEAAP